MSPLITGSLAFDYLMHINGRFSDRWPLSPDSGNFAAAYIATSLSRAFGGCAGNIAYALRMLGETPLMVATAGNDFTPYADYLHNLGISTDHVMILPDFYTAQAYMATDADNNQFIIFHPGATAQAHRQRVLSPPPPLAIVAPNGKEAMLQHCRDLAAAQTVFIFDPGQAVGMFSGDELLECLSLASYAIFNQSEFDAVQKATGLASEKIAAMTKGLFITAGERGSKVIADNKTITATCVHVGETKEPTGCGDAYRAGLLYGLARGWSWQPLLNFAAVIAAIKATHGGGQGYALSPATAAAAYEQAFHQPLPQ